jgi:hypothetical protein
MISQSQIDRLLGSEDYGRLIERILSNGRCRSIVARDTLRQPGALLPAALGLALQRITELTYRPAPLADRLALSLVAIQREDGMFGSDSASAPAELAATAIALRGLIGWIACRPTRADEHVQESRSAVARGLQALSRRSRAPDLQVDALGWAIALWQMGDLVEFRSAVAIEKLLQAVGDCGAELIEPDLRRYARAMAA